MKPACKRPVVVRNVMIGGHVPLVCIPLVAEDGQALLAEARASAQHAPDLLEWRADYFKGVVPDTIEALLSALRTDIGQTPLIFTYRSPREGGRAPDDLRARLGVIAAALESPYADLVDFELDSGEQAVAEVRQMSRDRGKHLILSWHDFSSTPDAVGIHFKLSAAQVHGADIAKVAVTPQCNADVLTLLSATLAARSKDVDIPIISMSMGERGVASRVVGHHFGSDVTFARGLEASAPGQIPIADLRAIWRLLP